MIDYFALALTHALILIALVRVMMRPELDREDLLADEEPVPVRPDRRAARRARRAPKAAQDQRDA